MNLFLIDPADLDGDTALIHTDRLAHLRSSQRDLPIGRELRIGIVGGKCGIGKIINSSDEQIELNIKLTHQPPEPLSLTLITAIPRPKMLKRILANAAEFGIKEIYLINTWKTEKSFLQSEILLPDKINHYLSLGLEQACDTIMPEVHIRERFKPFVEDELTVISNNKAKVIAHPTAEANISLLETSRPSCVFIGPEAGFNDFEIELLTKAGFKAYSFGERIYKVENAIALMAAHLSIK